MIGPNTQTYDTNRFQVSNLLSGCLVKLKKKNSPRLVTLGFQNIKESVTISRVAAGGVSVVESMLVRQNYKIKAL